MKGPYSSRDQNLSLDTPALTPVQTLCQENKSLVSKPSAQGSVTPPLCTPGPTPSAGPGPLQLLLQGPGCPGGAPPTSLRSAGRKRPPSPTVTLRFLPLPGQEGTFPVHTKVSLAEPRHGLSRCPSCPWNQLWGLGSR